MVKQIVLAFFKPTWSKIILIVIFVFVTFVGTIQTSGFAYDEEDRQEHPPPPLYDELRYFPFWPLMILLLSPILLSLGGSMPAGPSDPVNVTIIIVYFYLLSCVVIFCLRKLGNFFLEDTPQKVKS